VQDHEKSRELQEKRSKQEYYNNRTKKAKYGEFVVYGNEIELIHKASGKIVTIVKNSTVLESKFGTFLELRDAGRPEKCDFKILPRYKYRAEGEKIIFGDYFFLYNESTKSNVHISPSVINKIEEQKNDSSYRPKVKFRRTPSSVLYSKNVMEMKLHSSSRLQLIPFKHAEQDNCRFICGGDIIRIKHTEIGGYLCIDGTLDSSHGPLCFVRKYRGTDILEERKDSNCLFEVEMN